MRSELMIAIEKLIADKHLSQIEAAKVLKVSQSRVSDLRRCTVEKLSLDMLLTFASCKGCKVQSKPA